MNPKEENVMPDEFDRLANEIASPDYQRDLERRVHDHLAAETRWHNDVLARSRELGDHEVLRDQG
jgi:hypothetical protein